MSQITNGLKRLRYVVAQENTTIRHPTLRLAILNCARPLKKTSRTSEHDLYIEVHEIKASVPIETFFAVRLRYNERVVVGT